MATNRDGCASRVRLSAPPRARESLAGRPALADRAQRSGVRCSVRGRALEIGLLEAAALGGRPRSVACTPVAPFIRA